MRRLRIHYRRFRRRLKFLRRRLFCVIDQSQLEAKIAEVIADRCPLLLVHSSLSNCGYIPSGPEGVIDALQKRCDTLCMPTHTYCYPRNGITETYDPRETWSRSGLITDVFWELNGVLRSVHPTHSLAASGPEAEELCRDHHLCQTACGSDTPYRKLLDRNTSVLMYGTTMHTYTLFHCAEDESRCSYLYKPEPYNLLARDFDGTVHQVTMHWQDMKVRRRFRAMKDELQEAGLLRVFPFGMGELLFIPDSQQVHAYTIAKLRENELYLVQDFGETPRARWKRSA